MSETTFGPQLFPKNSPPRLQVLISNLTCNVPITVFLESNPSLPDAFETQLISTWSSLSGPARECALQKILETVQVYYLDQPPRFSLSPFLRTLPESGELIVEEHPDPRLLHKLRLPEEITPANTYPRPKLYPLSSLHPCPLSSRSPRSWSSQIQLVTLSPPSPRSQPKKYIAKGPSTNFSEFTTLLSLPPHPNVIPPPHGLITVSPTDHRVVGFLLEYYPHGNLDELSSSLKHRPVPETLWRWGRQLVTAVHWLHIEQHTFHGDIKPDNIVIRPHPSGKEQLVLIDFSQGESTAATAPPEAKGGAFPRTWSSEALEKADVYALGRTLYILAKGLSMNKLYMEFFRDAELVYETDLEGISGGLREVVRMCMRLDPAERPGLEELRRIFEGEGDGLKVGVGKVKVSWSPKGRMNMNAGVIRRFGERIGGFGVVVNGMRQALENWGGGRS